MKNLIPFAFLVLALNLQANDTLYYTLSAQAGDPEVRVRVQFNEAVNGPIRFVVPRSAPGTYEITDYSRFVEYLDGTTDLGALVPAEKGIGSYYDIRSEGSPIQTISYAMNIDEMEDALEGWASSKRREGYMGLLGYSVFGFVEGMENQPIHLTIEVSPDWPVFSTLQPGLDRPQGEAQYNISHFAELADAQYLLGDSVKIIQVAEAEIPLFAAVFSETEVNLEAIGQMGQQSLALLDDYFGFTPMPHYTMVYEYLNPRTPQHTYNFSIEHLNSMTATFDLSVAPKEYDPQSRYLRSLIHHMGHSWVPLRCYGGGYRPFSWQVAPLIETIWLHEGFIWYVLYEVSDNEGLIKMFRETVDSAPDFIKRLSLKELSYLASTQYSSDFRIGRNAFSRGALLAYELDQLITEKTGGQKSFRDALLNLYRWSQEHQQALPYEEIVVIMGEGLGVDLEEVWERWKKGQ
jgi:predicted metalloprotease with PDZ domain